MRWLMAVAVGVALGTSVAVVISARSEIARAASGATASPGRGQQHG